MRLLVNIILLLSIIAIIAYGVMRNNAVEDHTAEPAMEASSLTDMRALVEAEMASLPTSPTLNTDGYNRLAALGGGLVKISYGDVTTADGLTSATDVRITKVDDDSMGIKIDRLTIWGGDVDGILALAGGDLASEFRVADRLEMQGLRSFGFETLLESFSNKTNEVVLDAMEDAIGEDISEALDEQDMSVDVQKYEFSAESLVLEGLTYHGVSGLPDMSGDLGAWDLVSMMAKFYRSMSVDLSAYTNLSYDAMMEDAHETTQMSMTSPMIAATGYNRGDVDLVLYDDFSVIANIIGRDAAASMPSMELGIRLKGLGWTGFQISSVLEAVEAHTLPSMDDTDILSLGKWTLRGFDYSLNGQTFYSIAAADIDASHFHWLIPTQIAGTVDGETLHLGALGDGVIRMLVATGEMDNADQIKKIVSDVQASLQKYDLDDLVFNSNFDIQWSPETGRTTWDQVVDFEGFSNTTLDVNGMLPTYDAIKTAAAESDETEAPDPAAVPDEMEYAVPAPSPRSLAFQETFASSASLDSLKLAISDKGGIDKSFALAVDIAKIVPTEIDSPQLQMLRQSDPEQLKNGIAAIVNLAAGQAGAEFPPAKEWMHSVANFLLSGGTLTLAIEPEQPITAETLATLDAMEGPPSPDVIVDTFGISVTQTSP